MAYDTIWQDQFRVDRADNQILEITGRDEQDETWKVEYQNGYTTWLSGTTIEQATRPHWLQRGDRIRGTFDRLPVQRDWLLLRTFGLSTRVLDIHGEVLQWDVLRRHLWVRKTKRHEEEEL